MPMMIGGNHATAALWKMFIAVKFNTGNEIEQRRMSAAEDVLT